MVLFYSHSPLRSLAAFQTQADAVGNHGDEFAVGRLSAGVMDSVAKEGIQHIHIASVPCNFNGVTLIGLLVGSTQRIDWFIFIIAKEDGAVNG